MMQTVLVALVNQRQQQHLQQLPVIQQCSGLGLYCLPKDL
jgi:hypothetical protein